MSDVEFIIIEITFLEYCLWNILYYIHIYNDTYSYILLRTYIELLQQYHCVNIYISNVGSR